jgi:hypothetical protein
VPYNPSATPDVLDIDITKDLVFQVHLTMWYAVSSNHLPVLIDTQCRSSFLSTPDRPVLRKTNWPKFQAYLEAGMPSSTHLPNKWAIDTCVKELTGANSKALADSSLKCRPRADPRPPLLAHIQDKIRLLNRLRRQWQITKDPALKADVNRLQR